MGGVGAGSHGQVQNLKNKGDRTTFKKTLENQSFSLPEVTLFRNYTDATNI